MPCILRFNAPDCDIDAIAAMLDLPIERLYRQGEPRTILSKRGSFTKSGLHIVTSEAEFEEFKQQVADTIAFVNLHLTALQKSAALATQVEDCQFVFDFAISTRIFDTGVQVDYFPPELVRLVGKLSAGIVLSQY